MYTFIYLEKAFGRVQGPYKGCGIVVGFGKGVTLKYMKLLKDMYYKAITSVRTSGGITSEFPITKGLH